MLTSHFSPGLFVNCHKIFNLTKFRTIIILTLALKPKVSRTHVAQKPNGTEQIRKINERTLTLKALTLNFSAVTSAIGENVIHIWREKKKNFKEKIRRTLFISLKIQCTHVI